MNRFLLTLIAFALLLPAAPVFADDVPTTPDATIVLDPQDFELLPLTNVEKMAFAAEHPKVAQRAQVLARRAKRLRDQYNKRKNKKDAGSKKIASQLTALKKQVGPATGQLLELLADKGFTPEVAKAMQACPRGPYRTARYAQSLVLVVPDLSAEQRALMETATERMVGAYQALLAQKERLRLTVKQTDLDAANQNALLKTFDRQLYLNDQRFWRLVDYVLTEEQRAKLGRSLPGPYREKANAIEHLFRLPDLSPEQFARVKAVLTEAEAETSADKAAQKRLRAELKKKGLSADERKTLRAELAAAGKRLGELYLDTAKQTKAVLTPAQVQSWEAIPPRVSANDRRDRVERVLQGAPLTAAQRAQMDKMRKALRAEVRGVQNKRREVARMGADYGPDSPQQMMMQSMMAGIEAEGATLNRAFLGRVFLEVMTPDQTCGWLLGRFGYKR